MGPGKSRPRCAAGGRGAEADVAYVHRERAGRSPPSWSARPCRPTRQLQLYYLFPLSPEEETLNLVRGLLLGGAVLLGLLTAIVAS